MSTTTSYEPSRNGTTPTVPSASPRRATELRRRLLALSVRIHWHPFWSTSPGRTPAAWVELRQRMHSMTS
ncbi:hypothetical protein [Streptomyces sp. NBC_01166]|uniref:hypothetical protein n=1 Tax=Streptomyces sp. NBC_01166 TaxID=2903755 RepID=UPI00386B4C13